MKSSMFSKMQKSTSSFGSTMKPSGWSTLRKYMKNWVMISPYGKTFSTKSEKIEKPSTTVKHKNISVLLSSTIASSSTRSTLNTIHGTTRSLVTLEINLVILWNPSMLTAKMLETNYKRSTSKTCPLILSTWSTISRQLRKNNKQSTCTPITLSSY